MVRSVLPRAAVVDRLASEPFSAGFMLSVASLTWFKNDLELQVACAREIVCQASRVFHDGGDLAIYMVNVSYRVCYAVGNFINCSPVTKARNLRAVQRAAWCQVAAKVKLADARERSERLYGRYG